MLDFLTNPLVLAAALGPTVGISWTKKSNKDSNVDEPDYYSNVSVIGNRDITANEGSIDAPNAQIIALIGALI